MRGSSRSLAAASLAVMFCGFVIALYLEKTVLQNNLWVLLLMSGFEAGLIGGLADWFAVTALFRHPFGIPIPHTAILPKNRERVTNALISMVENDLLNKKSIQDKLQTLDIVRLGLTAARKGLYNNAVKTTIAKVLRSLLNAIPQEQVQRLLREALFKLLKRAEIGQLLKVLANEALERKMDELLLDQLLEKTLETMQGESFCTAIGNAAVHAAQQMPKGSFALRTIPTIVGMMGPQRTGKLLQEFLLATARDLRMQGNATRSQLLVALRDTVKQMMESDSLPQPMQNALIELVSGDVLDHQIARSLSDLILQWQSMLEMPEILDHKILPYFDELLAKAEQNNEWINRLEGYLDEHIARFLDSHHEDIGRLIRENVNRFDTNLLVEKMEGKFGNDLQWIRVNGAICGFAVGMVLFGLKTLAYMILV